MALLWFKSRSASTPVTARASSSRCANSSGGAVWSRGSVSRATTLNFSADDSNPCRAAARTIGNVDAPTAMIVMLPAASERIVLVEPRGSRTGAPLGPPPLVPFDHLFLARLRHRGLFHDGLPEREPL